ncbi:MAG: tetratricopeptide repeat protein [Alphaproteobacteria bacterium]|nr:tetratricopeptide repeat protein [Alphaproteobacteria bacterium]
MLGNRAKVRLDRGDVAGAIDDYIAALERDPVSADLLFNAAGALAMAGRLEDAVARLETACEADPDHARAHANLGNLLRQLGRNDEAIRVLERAVEIAPGDPQVQHSLGVTLMQLRDYEAAAARFRRALDLDKGFVRTAAQLFYANLHACDWRDHDKLVANFTRLLESGRPEVAEVSPLIALHLPVAQKTLNTASAARARTFRDVPVDSGSLTPATPRGRLRVGYMSADFGRHPVGHLTADLFRHHDRTKFDAAGILLAPPDGSDVSERIAATLDTVLDVSRMSASEAAEQIRELGVDVLVDLGGYTRGARPEILANRAAPLQIGWLGYCGSSGGLNDVLLADTQLVREAETNEFPEAVARLPGSLMPLNNFDSPGDEPGARKDHGLPEDAFVYCAFNTPTKIDPLTFSAWMNILNAVEGSVLWLREHAPLTTRNLQVAAQSRGIDPRRLVFAKTVPGMADHLARHLHADMFLDTFVYGAHSTAADAIAMGLPVLTRAGDAMPARVGASLAHAFDLADAVVDSTDAYVEAAVSLARDRARLTDMSRRLRDARRAKGDSAGFVSRLEAAYQQLWDLAVHGRIAPGECVDIETGKA